MSREGKVALDLEVLPDEGHPNLLHDLIDCVRYRPIRVVRNKSTFLDELLVKQVICE